MSVQSVSRIDTLNKDNYDTWKIQMEALLIKNDAWSYVNGEIKQPAFVGNDETSRKAVEAWKKADSKAKSDIILSISPSELKQIKNCSTSRDVWLKLETIYQSKGPARKATLLKQLTLQRMEEGTDVREHLGKFFDAVDKLNDMGVEINADLLAIMLLYSLPSTFENFRCAIESRDELPTPEVLRIKILEEYDARKSEVRGNVQDALLVKRKFDFRRNQGRRNTESGRNGGGSKDGGSKGGTSEENMFKFKCHRCRKVGHKATDCLQKGKTVSNSNEANCSENVGLLGAETFSAETTRVKSNWCIDSGATSHLCRDIDKFSSFKDNLRENLNLANNSSTEILGTGTANFAADVLGELKNISLSNALYVPDLRTNLISVSKITNNNLEILFKKDTALVFDPDGKVKLIADRVGDLYYARECKARNSAFTTTESRSNVELWHCRLGHLNIKDLLECVRKGIVRGVQLGPVDTNFKLECEICAKGKMTRKPFPKKSEKDTEVLEIIHTDVCGPMRVESLSKAKYYVEFIDDRSRYCTVYFIKHKNEVIKKTKEYINYVQNLHNKKVKCIQSDNGTEYVNKEMDDFLKENGITRRLTSPYCPEQNGVSERKNRSLLDTTRCLLIQSGLPPKFWAEAANTANYLRNRCPTKSLNGLTPFEAWYGKCPDVSHLQNFGCKVLCLNNDLNKSKLDPRCKEGIFVGYSEETKGFRVWLPVEQKVIISRDVKFLRKVDPTTEEFEDFISDELYEDFQDKKMEVTLEPIEQGSQSGGEEEEDDNLNEVRGPGRPRLVRSGNRGRPKKIYNMVPGNPEAELVEQAFLGEIPMRQALCGSEIEEWYDAMAEEITNIIRKDTWTLVERPTNQEVLGSRIVLRNKYKANGILEKKKARLVAQGFNQKPGIHFNETFAPVARLSSVRLVTALAAHLDMKIHQLDVTSAYLNGVLEETIFMEPPRELSDVLNHICKSKRFDPEITQKARKMLDDLDRKVCLLNKSLYGLKQAGRVWYFKLDKILKECGATPTKADPCVYQIRREGVLVLILIYVDDILILSQKEEYIDEIKINLSNKVDLKDLGNVGNCLGIEFTRTPQQISLHQRGYIKDILQRFGMTDCNPVSTPLDKNVKLSKSEDRTPEDEELPYRELIGALTYLAQCTRPDISFSVSYLSQFNNCYKYAHWTAAKRILRYIKGTIDLGLVYESNSEGLTGYCDADWGNCTEDRRSFTGFCFILSNAPIVWESKKQHTVALSTTEAEYMSLTEAAKEAIYLERFLLEMQLPKLAKAKLFIDNMSALKLSSNPTYHARSKHIDIKYHFVREALSDGHFSLHHIGTDDMCADILTKSLPRPKHVKCVNLMGLESVRETCVKACQLEGKC